MMYAIHMGVPEMEDLWNNLQVKVRTGTANKDEEKLYFPFFRWPASRHCW